MRSYFHQFYSIRENSAHFQPELVNQHYQRNVKKLIVKIPNYRVNLEINNRNYWNWWLEGTREARRNAALFKNHRYQTTPAWICSVGEIQGTGRNFSHSAWGIQARHSSRFFSTAAITNANNTTVTRTNLLQHRFANCVVVPRRIGKKSPVVRRQSREISVQGLANE